MKLKNQVRFPCIIKLVIIMRQKDFIEYVKKKRISQMISQKDLAKSIPIASSTYSKIENHKQNPSFFVIQRLAEIFDIDLNILKNSPKDFIDYD